MGGCGGFDFFEAGLEGVAGGAEGLFGVDFEEAGEVYEGEEDVAEFFVDALLVAGGEGLFEFVGFFGDFVEDGVDVLPVEA